MKDQFRVHEDTAKSLKPFYVFCGLLYAVGIGIQFVEWGLRVWLRLDEETLSNIVVYTLLGLVLVVPIFFILLWHWLGLMPRRQVLETRRSPVPQEWIRLDDVIEILPTHILMGGRLLLAMVIMIVLLALFGGAAMRGEMSIWYILIAPLTFCLVLVLDQLEKRVPMIRLDAEGVTLRRSRLSIRTARTPWSEIDTCELVGYYDETTAQFLIYPVFYDAAGTRRSSPGSLTWFTVDPAARNRVLGYLKSRFPKLDIDPWDDWGKLP